MKKKSVFVTMLIILIVLVLSTGTIFAQEYAPAAAAVKANPTSARVLVNGKSVTFDAYSINNNNYFKLRDLGKYLEFNVDWDAATNCVIIDTVSDFVFPD